MHKSEEGLWELIGLVSWGIGCASETPGIYVDVYEIRDWISEEIPGLDFGKKFH